MKLFKVGYLSLNRIQEDALHAFRCFLILQVIFGHLIAMSIATAPEIIKLHGYVQPELIMRICFRFGREAAYFFVFLSGFLVGGKLLWQYKNEVPVYIESFIKKRILRIYPILFLALIFTSLVDWYGTQFLGMHYNLEVFGGYSIGEHSGVIGFLGNVLALQPVFVGAYGSNGPLWTLGYIFQFYLIGLFVLRFVTLYPHLKSYVILLLGIIGMASIKVEWGLLFVLWLLGALMRNVAYPNLNATLCLIISAVIMLVATMGNYIQSILSVGLAGVFLIIFLGKLDGPHFIVSNRLTRKLIDLSKAISNMSYEMYAFHFPLALFLGALFGMSPNAPFVASLFFIMFTFCVIIFVGYVIKNLVTLVLNIKR